MALSVFVYPRRSDATQDFETAVSAALAAHEKGSIEHFGEQALLLQGRAVTAHTALIRYVEFGQQVRSWLILVPHGIYFYKVRATIPAQRTLQGSDEAWIALIQAFDNLDFVLAAEDFMKRPGTYFVGPGEPPAMMRPTHPQSSTSNRPS